MKEEKKKLTLPRDSSDTDKSVWARQIEIAWSQKKTKKKISKLKDAKKWQEGSHSWRKQTSVMSFYKYCWRMTQKKAMSKKQKKKLLYR